MADLDLIVLTQDNEAIGLRKRCYIISWFIKWWKFVD